MVLSMERWQGKVAVVTGASAGIGAGIAKKLVEEGLKVVGLARRVERVQELANSLSGAKGKMYAVKCDMTSEDDILNAFKWTKDNVGPVSILVNNAGIIQPTNMIDGDTKMWKKLLDTNVLGLCIATKEAVTQMRQNDIAGHIININSIAGQRNIYFPQINLYTASKHAVTAVTQTFSKELNAHNLKIKMTSISPGTVTSEILETNNFVMEEDVLKKQREITPQIEAEDIADAVVYVLSTNPKVQIPELTIQPVGETF
ncbi:farnesol dehydrogenase [Aethina tumida]|uniref:farnesol dehydrogenase n=1 Tax=Aethina tumida TaxID=116153 RepID=UPI00096B30B1|nr:farnesol dehydrogenase [Aethina tumida]